MDIIRLSSKGQIVIPKEIRDKYGLKRGSKVTILEYPDEIVIVPLPEDSITAARGAFKSRKSVRRMLEDIRRDERRADKAKPKNPSQDADKK